MGKCESVMVRKSLLMKLLPFPCYTCGSPSPRMASSPHPSPLLPLHVDSPITPPSSSSSMPKFSSTSALNPHQFELLDLLARSDHLAPIPLTEQQVGFCREAFHRLAKKLNVVGGRRTIAREFDSLLVDRTQMNKFLARATIGRLEANQRRNRYLDVLPYDDTRVPLEVPVNSSGLVSSYINASYVVDPVHENLPKFIATQGPLQNTMVDFWEMVAQQQCPVIVMLTGFVDQHNKMVKCDNYFPTQIQEFQIHGRFKITNKFSKVSESAVARHLLEIEHHQATPVPVLHIQYLDWPDNGIPASTVSVQEMFKILYRIPPNFGPYVVHCSAGIGRTGTFCTIDHTLRRILLGDLSAVDIENTVRNFRQQRFGMVQTREQYLFCYTTVIAELQDLISKKEV